MTQKIENVILLKVGTCKTCDTENQRRNTFKVKHVKHVTHKIKDVTLLKIHM